MKKLIILAVVCCTSSVFATDYNLINDWTLDGTNPDGAWSYGSKYEATTGSGNFDPFVSATIHSYDAGNGYDQWIVTNTYNTCNVWYANGGLWTFPAHSVIANAWDNYSSVVHWAGDAGTYNLSTVFQGGGYTTPTPTYPDSIVYVIKNDSTVLFSQEVLGFNSANFAQQITMGTGDYLDFVVEEKTAGAGESRASIDASLVAVPEPTTVALLGLGGLLLWRKRR